MKSSFHHVTLRNGARRYRIKVLEKALAVLDLLGETGGEFTPTEVAVRLGLSVPTAFRIVTVLDDASFLEKAPGAQGYRLGFKLSRLGSLVNGTTSLQRVARPFLEALQKRCGETVHLTVLKNGEALYLDKIEGQQRVVRVVSRVGMRLPAHCSGVGKVLLAHLPDAQVGAIVRERGLARWTPNTITSRTGLRAELGRIRQQGYAVDDEEIEVGLKCVAAPIRDACERVVGAVSISGPKSRFDDAETEKLVTLVLEASKRISKAMSDEAAARSKRQGSDGTRIATTGKQRGAARG